MKKKLLLASLVVGTFALVAQPTDHTSTTPGDVLGAFGDAAKVWGGIMLPYAKGLFWLLALVEFAWSAGVLMLEGADFHGWTATIVRTFMFIGFWWTLLVNAADWIPSIVQSFDQIGRQSAGQLGVPIGGPSDILVVGLKLAIPLISSDSVIDGLMAPASTALRLVAAVLIVLGFVCVALCYVMTWVEAYLLMSVGYVLLGFGGSRWTSDYAAKYIGLAAGTGLKLLLLYSIVGLGARLAAGWMPYSTAGGAANCLELIAGSILFALVAWHVPRLFSSLMSGAPSSIGHSEVIAGAAGVGALAARVGMMSGGGAAAGSAGGVGSSGAGSAGASGAATSNGHSGGGVVNSGSGSSVAAQVSSVKAANTSVSPPNGRK